MSRFHRVLRHVVAATATILIGSLAPAVARAQAVVDPTTAEFSPSTDHNTTLGDGSAAVSRYDLGFYLVGAASPVQVNALGKPAPQTDGKIRVSIGAKPSAGIVYEARVSAVGPGGSSASGVSNAFSFSVTCSFSVSPTSQTVAAGGGPASVTVTSTTGCAWTATSNATWLTITSGSSGTGNGTVGYSAAANTSTSSRTGTLTVAGTTVTVSQGAPNTAPAITTQPANRSVALNQTATFTVGASGNPAPTYKWQLSTDGGATWTAVTDGGAYSGASTTVLTVAGITSAMSGSKYRAVATNTAGSATSAAATLTVIAYTTPTSLNIGAIKKGGSGNIVSSTPPQKVTVILNATGSWAVTVDQPWLKITNGSGSGSGRFSVDLINPDDVLGATVNATASITVTFSGVSVSSIVIPVNLSVQLTTSGAAPYGQVDSPLQDATGVQGAIGITGWALDDIGVTAVRIYRSCLTVDPAAACQNLLGRSLVYVGDAAFLAGARPDLEAAFSTSPYHYRGGWGYLLLTNMLPDVASAQPHGGRGKLTLYAVAIDVEGHETLLGRAWGNDATPTSITLSNDTIAKPFGALDTPAQGATVSGVLANFGWTLTPDADTTAGAGDILVPTNGSSTVVFIDGVAVGTVAYNQCRGTVGNPVPGGQYCNDDVANIFGNAIEQPTLTVRTSNPTRFRNLDAGRAAIGAYAIDTTALTNGVHTIAWSVTDSAGRVEGIGSRFFTVLNSGTTNPPEGRDKLGPYVGAELASAPQYVTAERVPATQRVLGRMGFDLTAPFEELMATRDGVYQVTIPELSLLELSLGGPVKSAALLVGDAERDLPAGSHLEGGTGVFTWMPPAGYLGTYRLAFRTATDVTTVDATLRPAASTVAGESEIRMYVDLPAQDTTIHGPVTIAGWALDSRAFTGAGIGAVHVWARPTDRAGAAAQFLGAAELHGYRPDVGRIFGASFDRSGFGLTSTLAPGTYEIIAYAFAARTGRFQDARTINLTVR